MRHKRLAILVLLGVHACIAHAGEQLNLITVTASRTATSTKEVGSSISVINEKDINQRQVSFVSELLRDVPGTAVSQNGGAGSFTQLRLRGAESNQTLVLIDGIEANDIGRGAEFDFANLLTCGIERIEVLRGPQSSLWGSDALAGVVNVQTKQGEGPLNIESTFSGGRFDTYQNCTGVNVGNHNHSFSMYGAYLDTNGTNTSELGSEDDGYRNGTLSFRYDLTAFDNLQIDLAGRHIDATVETDPGSPPVDGNRETETIQNYLRVNTLLDTFDGAWAHQFGVGITDTDNENFADRIETSSTKGEKLKLDYQSNVYFSTPELADSEHVLTFVFERERERFEQTGTPSFFGDPNQRQKIYNTGYVGEYRIGFADQIFLAASVRHDDNDEFKDRTTHRFSLSYAPDSVSTQFHAAYGTGIKNPTFTERFGFTPDTFIGNPDIKPEKSTGWEAGLSHNFGDRISVGATYFEEELEDEINGFFFDPNLGAFTAINLEGNSNRKGVELNFNAYAAENLTLQGSYTYVESKEPNGTGKTSEIRRPKNVASLIGNYRFLAGKANVNLRINYTDDQFDNDFSSFPAQRVELHDYTLVNLAGEYQLNKHVVLEGRIENIFDKEYQDVFGFETQGINAHLGIKFLTNL